MKYVIIIMQLVVAISILNVWLIQNKKNTRWRGGNATTLIEEFKVYGLPVWMCYLVGVIKVGLAIALIASIWYPELRQWSAFGLAVMLTGSIFMHIKINDPLYKSFPAFLFLSLCLLIAFL